MGRKTHLINKCMSGSREGRRFNMRGGKGKVETKMVKFVRGKNKKGRKNGKRKK